MSCRVDYFKPLKPGNDPDNLGTVRETFMSGHKMQSADDYDIFLDKGEVLVFKKSKDGSMKCAQFLAQGMAIVSDADELFKFYNGKHPRKEK